jgi:tRNA nucleotidyltransferase (CCA-adding enzyme)
MLRYGYEGYPVVQAGKVVGLLNRRSVDRALSHKLNKKTAASLMDAGEVSVHPEDSLEHLQRVMTETGWGQVPVVQAETGQIIGIVTRTDLLKTLAGAQASQPAEPADRLENAPTTRLSLLRRRRVAHSSRCLFIVGGFVRDLFSIAPARISIWLSKDAIELARNLARAYGGRVTSHSRFGTAKWHIGGVRPDLVDRLQNADKNQFAEGKPQPTTRNFNVSDLPEFVDLITARSEFYTHPTALPTVERGSIKLDLHRRDFTINTLALRLDGYHYGELRLLRRIKRSRNGLMLPHSRFIGNHSDAGRLRQPAFQSDAHWVD